MDLGDLLTIGAAAFKNSPGSGNAGSNLDVGTVIGALSSLSGGQGGINLGTLMNGMQQNGMGDILQSWLGDGDNQAVSGDQIKNLFGSDQISAFASQLGLSESDAIGGLQDAVPQLMDNASQGGSLLDSIGGIEGAMGLASKFLGR